MFIRQFTATLLALIGIISCAVFQDDPFELVSVSNSNRPVVTGISPTSGPPGTVVTLSGSGFSSQATVTIGGAPCEGITVLDSTTLTCTTSAETTAGSVTIVVTNPGGNSSPSFDGGFTAVLTPTVTSVSPSGGALAGGVTITITGTNFASGASVTIGGTAATSVVVVSSTTITCVTPAASAGSATIAVTNSGGSPGSLSNGFTYRAAPTFTAVTASSGALAGGTSVTITGTGFVAGVAVTFDGTTATSISVVNSTTITCVTPAHAAGAVNVVVTNSDNQTVTGGAAYTYQAAPTVSAVSPVTGFPFGGTTLTITGTGFLSAPTVTVGGTAATSVTVVSSTSITCVTPAHATGASDVVVTNTDSQSATSSSAFTFRAQRLATDGSDNSCFIKSNNTLKCWGGNTQGELGQGNTTARGDGANEMGSNLAVTDVGTGRTAAQITTSGGHTCALLDNSTVKCWGEGAGGGTGYGSTTDLGDGAGEMGDSLSTVDLGTGRTGKMIVTGYWYTCAILDNDSLKCWGRNNKGQLGQGHTNSLGDGANEMGDNLTAIDLGTGRTAKQVALGDETACALLDNGTVKCWGDNTQGGLGQGNTNVLGNNANEMGDNLAAISLGTGRTATQIAVGLYHACALLDNGTVKCWGGNSDGQLGQGNTNSLGDGANEMGDNLTAISLGTGRTATAISASYYGACAILDNGDLKCWGNGGNGELGTGNTNDLGDGANEMGDNLTAVNLGTGRTAKELASARHGSVCAVLDNDSVKCWGYNPQGGLGQGHINNLGDGANEMGDNLSAISL